jgi:hypothetical protein
MGQEEELVPDIFQMEVTTLPITTPVFYPSFGAQPPTEDLTTATSSLDENSEEMELEDVTIDVQSAAIESLPQDIDDDMNIDPRDLGGDDLHAPAVTPSAEPPATRASGNGESVEGDGAMETEDHA